jgi:hypothetical protein
MSVKSSTVAAFLLGTMMSALVRKSDKIKNYEKKKDEKLE